jgi:hypothetical protein
VVFKRGFFRRKQRSNIAGEDNQFKAGIAFEVRMRFTAKGRAQGGRVVCPDKETTQTSTLCMRLNSWQRCEPFLPDKLSKQRDCVGPHVRVSRTPGRGLSNAG